jgi:hypothetical protein
MIESLLEHDPGLHLPLHFPRACGPHQPTAFSRVEYRFSTDGFIRSEGPAYIPSLSALTSIGNYDTREGELILWTEKKVVNFPVGSTILLPKWMPYSFTAVESPGFQMLLTQTCENAVCDYVANGFSSKFGVVEYEGEKGRKSKKREAEAGAALFGTLNEFDGDFEDNRGLGY